MGFTSFHVYFYPMNPRQIKDIPTSSPVSFFPIFLFILFACGGSGTKQPGMEEVTDLDTVLTDQLPAKPQNKVLEQKVKDQAFGLYPRLSNENCVEFLRAFGDTIASNIIAMHTSYGDIVVKLYDDTPIHRANFLYLIERKYFVPTQLVRIVPDFVIQGGNSEEIVDQEKRFLIGEYTLPHEMSSRHPHFKGALAMSRSYENNPEKRSSAYDFYIVDGRKCSQTEMYRAAQKNGREYTRDELNKYMTQGGAPHLDSEHTVFGEVISGMDVVERIMKVETDASDWPIEEIELSMEVMP